MRSFISLLSTVIIFLSLLAPAGAEANPQYPERKVMDGPYGDPILSTQARIN